MGKVWSFLKKRGRSVATGVGMAAKWVWKKLPKTRRGIGWTLLVFVFLVALFVLVYILLTGDAEAQRFVMWGLWIAVLLLAGVALLKVVILVKRRMDRRTKNARRRAAKKKNKAQIAVARKKFWNQPSFWVWLVLAVSALVLAPMAPILIPPDLMVLLPRASQVKELLAIALEIAIVVVLAVWLKRCLVQVGSVEVPAQAVLARFGRPIDAVGPGLYFCFKPFERFKIFPTGQYFFNFLITEGLYTKESGGLSSQPLKVAATIYLRFPRVDRNYRFPIRDAAGNIVWEGTSGHNLLMHHLYFRLPIRDLMATDTVDKLGVFFERGVMGGLRHVMSGKTSKQCKEEKPSIEAETANYLLTETGNPFFECGLPKECVDLEITQVKLPDETEKAYIEPELAQKRAEAAVHEKESIQLIVAAYKDAGVSPDIAGILVAGIVGGREKMTIADLRDFKILEAAGKWPARP